MFWFFDAKRSSFCVFEFFHIFPLNPKLRLCIDKTLVKISYFEIGFQTHSLIQFKQIMVITGNFVFEFPWQNQLLLNLSHIFHLNDINEVAMMLGLNFPTMVFVLYLLSDRKP